MLSHYQADLVCFLSNAAFTGLFIGALCGVLVGPAVRALRTRNADDLFAGFVLAVVPGAVVASTVSLSIAIFQSPALQPGIKGCYMVPDWFMTVRVCLVVITGAITAWWAACRDPHLRNRNRMILYVLLWVLGGGILSSFALVGSGFDGYFVIESNLRPLRHAMLGFVSGSAIVALWLFGIAALGRRLPLVDNSRTQGVPPSTTPDSTTGGTR